MREDVSRSPGGEGLDSSSEPLHLSPLSAGQLASRLALCERLGVGEGERQAHLLQRFQEVPGLYSALRAIRPELREGDLTPLIDVVLRAELPEDLLTALERSQAVCFSRGSFAFVWEALREHWSDTDFLADLNAHVDSLGDLYALLGEYHLRESFPIEQARSAAVVVSSSSAVEHDLRHLLSLGPENRCRDPIHLRRHYREYSHLLPSRYVVEDNSLQEVARAISRREGGFDPKMGEMFIRGIARLPTRLKAPVEKLASRRELSSAALSLLKVLLPRLQQLNSGSDQREVATALWGFSRDLPEQAQLGLRLCHSLFNGQESARRDFFPRFQEGDYEGLERELFTDRLLAEREHFSERPVEELVQELEEYRSERRDVPPSHIVERSTAAVVAIRERGASLHLLPDEALTAHLRELRSTAEERAAADLMAFRIELLAGLSELVRRQYQILPNASQLLTIVMSDEMAEEFGSDAVRGIWSELATGEGKSLVFTLKAIVHTYLGRKVDILAPNPYLAARDERVFRPLLNGAGVRGFHFEQWSRPSLPAGTDVVYSTLSTLCFAAANAQFTRRKLFGGQRMDLVLIDEADQLLIDQSTDRRWIVDGNSSLEEASEPVLWQRFFSLFAEESEKSLDRDLPTLVASAYEAAPLILGAADPLVVAQFVSSSIRSHSMEEGVDYVVGRDDETRVIAVIDRHETGRILQRTVWGQGLHQSVSLLRQLEPPRLRKLLGSANPYEFLRGYEEAFCGTGTIGGASERKELHQLYGYRGFHMPPNSPSRRVDLPLELYLTEAERDRRIEFILTHENGERERPVVVATQSIREANQWYERLRSRGPQLLSDVRNLSPNGEPSEEEILLGAAGGLGELTVSTFMIGRGSDIRLGSQDASERGGLHILGTGLPMTARGDAQLRGRAARQGEPGSSQIITSLESDLFLKSQPGAVQKALRVLVESYGFGSDEVRATVCYLREAAELLRSLERATLLSKREEISAALRQYIHERGKVKMPLTFRQQVLEYPETILSFLFSQWAVPLLDELELSPGSPSIRSQELDAAFERAFGVNPILFPTDREECFVENVERISDVYLDLVHRWEWCSSVLRRDDLSRFLALFHSNVREKTWDADQLAQIFFSE